MLKDRGHEGVRLALVHKTIAIVGLSKENASHSHKVAEYFKSDGYRVVPVNPFADEILGKKCYKSLFDMPEDIQETIEMVQIFGPPKDLHSIVEQAIQLREKHGKPYVVCIAFMEK